MRTKSERISLKLLQWTEKKGSGEEGSVKEQPRQLSKGSSLEKVEGKRQSSTCCYHRWSKTGKEKTGYWNSRGQRGQAPVAVWQTGIWNARGKRAQTLAATWQTSIWNTRGQRGQAPAAAWQTGIWNYFYFNNNIIHSTKNHLIMITLRNFFYCS